MHLLTAYSLSLLLQIVRLSSKHQIKIRLKLIEMQLTSMDLKERVSMERDGNRESIYSSCRHKTRLDLIVTDIFRGLHVQVK